MTINIRHRTIELTDAIRAYVEEKLADVGRFGLPVRHIDVEVGKDNNHHKNGSVFCCRATLELENGQTLTMDRDAADLYKAIDKVRDLIKEEMGDRHRENKPVRAEEVESVN